MYDYIEGKKRIEELIKNDLEVINNNRLPKSETLTFNNSYYFAPENIKMLPLIKL
mgnify:CR=1 FL=1